MTGLAGESAGAPTPMGAANQVGLDSISYDQIISLRRYIRCVLPLDGFVFYLRAPIVLAGGADLLNAHPMNVVANNQGQFSPLTGSETTVKGSMHMTSLAQQAEEHSATMNNAILTSKSEIKELNHIEPQTLWIARFDQGPDGDILEIAFSESSGRYQQAGIWHYRGQAINAYMRSQLVDAPSQLLVREAVVSDSLTAWLAHSGTADQPLMLFPSFAVPENLRPPYGVVHIDPAQTMALQAIPRIDQQSSSWQLARDQVRITLYGVRNNQAVDFLNFWIQKFVNTDGDPLGLGNLPIIRDEKQNQLPFQALAMKKTISFEVSYYQARMQEIARKLILSATLQLTISDTL